MESGVRSVCFRGDFTIRTLAVFMRKKLACHNCLSSLVQNQIR